MFKTIIAAIACFLSMYMLTAFVNLSFDLRVWSYDARLSCACLGFLTAAYGAMVSALNQGVK